MDVEWTSLPLELWRHVLDKAPIGDHVRLRLTCRRFYFFELEGQELQIHDESFGSYHFVWGSVGKSSTMILNNSLDFLNSKASIQSSYSSITKNITITRQMCISLEKGREVEGLSYIFFGTRLGKYGYDYGRTPYIAGPGRTCHDAINISITLNSLLKGCTTISQPWDNGTAYSFSDGKTFFISFYKREADLFSVHRYQFDGDATVSLESKFTSIHPLEDPIETFNWKIFYEGHRTRILNQAVHLYFQFMESLGMKFDN